MLDELELAYEDDDEVQMRPGRHRRPRSRLARSLLTLGLVIALFAALGGAGYWGVGKVRGFFTAPDFTGQGHGSVQVQVKPGDGGSEIANTLYSKGVVKSAKAFKNAANDNLNSQHIQPGFYALPKQMKASYAVVALLDSNNRIVTKVTIPEGWTTNKILTQLSEKLKVPLDDFKTAVKDPGSLGIGDNWYKRTDGKKTAKTVEGFLFADTYQFDPGTSAKDALSDMVQRFMENATDSGLDKPAGISPLEALIVASLVQAEGIPADFPKIARVVYNRLDSDDLSLRELHFDSTTNYWLDMKGKGAKESRDLTDSELHDAANPYNTTVHEGLPPGPIDCPGADAMKAAANPAPGNWTYFVRIDKSGKSAFTNDFAQHQRNIEKAKENGAG